MNYIYLFFQEKNNKNTTLSLESFHLNSQSRKSSVYDIQNAAVKYFFCFLSNLSVIVSFLFISLLLFCAFLIPLSQKMFATVQLIDACVRLDFQK